MCHRWLVVAFSWAMSSRLAARAGVLCAFAAWWTHYLDSVSAADAVQIPLSLLFLEPSGYYVDAVQLHVHAAEVLVMCGVHREGSRYPPFWSADR